MSVRSGVILFAVVCLLGTAAPARADQPDLPPNGRGMGTLDHPTNGNGNSQDPPGEGKTGGARGATGNGINYHGGPVLLGTTNVYYIWYGTWTINDTLILTDFATSIGGSPYFNINTTYYNGAGTHVANAVHYAGSTTDNYSQGSTNLTDGAIQTVVSSAISSGSLPKDTNALYFVLTSADVTKNGFCSQYCGWHTRATIAGADIKYSFVGDPTQCPLSCEEQTVGPNGSSGADGMASIIAHELEETVTDPDLNAWYDRRGQENADKCAWTFGSTYTAANGSQANMKLGSRDYLIQQNWVNSSKPACALSYQ